MIFSIASGILLLTEWLTQKEKDKVDILYKNSSDGLKAELEMFEETPKPKTDGLIHSSSQ